jgi:hypothetical protein
MGWRAVLKQKEPPPNREISEIPEIWDAEAGNVSDISHISATGEGSASLESIAEDCTGFFEERAAIMEYDGGLSREDAEAAAREATETQRLANPEPTWERRLKAMKRDRQQHGEIAGQ